MLRNCNLRISSVLIVLKPHLYYQGLEVCTIGTKYNVVLLLKILYILENELVYITLEFRSENTDN